MKKSTNKILVGFMSLCLLLNVMCIDVQAKGSSSSSSRSSSSSSSSSRSSSSSSSSSRTSGSTSSSTSKPSTSSSSSTTTKPSTSTPSTSSSTSGSTSSKSAEGFKSGSYSTTKPSGSTSSTSGSTATKSGTSAFSNKNVDTSSPALNSIPRSYSNYSVNNHYYYHDTGSGYGNFWSNYWFYRAMTPDNRTYVSDGGTRVVAPAYGGVTSVLWDLITSILLIALIGWIIYYTNKRTGWIRKTKIWILRKLSR